MAASAMPEGCFGVASTVPGNVWKVLVADGETVEAGQRLAIMESMKMEITVSAHAAGCVRTVMASPGQTLRSGNMVAILEAL